MRLRATPGVGDAYAPTSGDDGYDVERYDLELDYRVRTNRLVGVATIATFINAGGLGDMIVNGLKLQRYPVLVTGAVLVACIALLIDWIASVAEDLLTPRGI